MLKQTGGWFCGNCRSEPKPADGADPGFVENLHLVFFATESLFPELLRSRFWLPLWRGSIYTADSKRWRSEHQAA